MHFNKEWLRNYSFGRIEVIRKNMSAKSPKAKVVINEIIGHLSDDATENYKSDSSLSFTKLNGHSSDIENSRQKTDENELRLRLAVAAGNLGNWNWNVKTNEVIWQLPDESLNEHHSITPIQTRESFKSFIARVHKEDRTLVTDCLRQAIVDSKDYEVEFRITQTNLPRWLCLRGAMVFSDKVPKKSIGIIKDITKQKTTKEEHEKLIDEAKAARIEIIKAKKAKDEFLNTVSHELRTPLTSIVGWAHLIRSVKMSDEQVEYALSVIERNAIAQKRLIEDLLDTKRTINKNLNLKLQQVKLSAVVEAALEIVRPSAAVKKITLDYLHDTSEDRIMCDPTWLRQAILNLLTNAIAYTQLTGKVEVRIKESEKDHLRVFVRDTGKGIKAELLPSIFDQPRHGKDKQVQDVQNVSELGGLAAARNIVTLHGGSVEAFSDGENKGSTFILSLPRENHALSQIESRFLEGDDWIIPTTTKHSGFKDFSEEKELKDLRVLVVEDDVTTSKLFEFVMAHCGAKVKSCSSAAEAMQVLDSWQPDALVCDIGMPDIDGYTLINLIRQLPTRQSLIPAIAVTAYANKQTRTRALEAGFQQYITKPVLPEELARAVRAIVNSKQSKVEKKSDNNLIAKTNVVTNQNKISRTSSPNNVREIAAKNYLLKALSHEDFDRIEPFVTIVSLKAEDILCKPDEFIKYVYFPINCVVSLLSITDDGTSIEAGMVGREGIVGLPVILGFDTMSTWASVTVGGQAVRVSSKQLKNELQAGGKLHNFALDYTRAFITQISQTAICNRRHTVEERLCTWLLLLQDCLGSHKLPLTQELISNRLGTRRPGISNCSRDLQKAGLIENARGKIYIKDRNALVTNACSCYEVIKAEYDSLYSTSRDKKIGLL